MAKRMKLKKQIISWILNLCLLVTAVVGYMTPLTVKAEGTTATGTTQVLYIAGESGSDENEGTSVDDALATLGAAYKKIPSDNVQTTIVICGVVNASEGAATLTEGDTKFYYPVGNSTTPTSHKGEVIITSVYGNENYKETASLSFGTGEDSHSYYFFGNTTLRNIKISKNASRIFADYYSMHLAEGIEGTVATTLFTGTTNAFSKYCSGQDVVLTINSGTVTTVYGGGSGYQGGPNKTKNNTVTININGGNITNLYGSGSSGNASTDSIHHKSIIINMNGGEVKDLYGAHASATVYGDIKITLNGGKVTGCVYGARTFTGTVTGTYDPYIGGNVEILVGGTEVAAIEVAQDTVDVWGNEIIHYSNAANASMSAISGFDTLKLTSSNVTVAQGMENVWSSITSLQMTDDSKLILLTAPNIPENQVKVSVTQAGDSWNITDALIVAPADTSDMFVLETMENKKLNYDSAVASWTLANVSTGEDDTTDETDTENSLVLYVDSTNGVDTNVGTSKETALKTLAAAYKKIPTDNVETTIVICGVVNASEGAATLTEGDTKFYYPVGNSTTPTAHEGKVIITSVYGNENYKETASLSFGTGEDSHTYYFFGDTTFKDLVINKNANRIFADYHSMHLAEGIEGTLATTLFAGTTNAFSSYCSGQDVVLTIDSGTVTTVYGGGSNYQGGPNKTKNNTVTININGGKITTLYGSGTSANASTDSIHHKSITINMNGGEVKNLYGAHESATVYEDIKITLNGGAVTNCVYGARTFTGTVTGTYDPYIGGNVEILVGGTEVAAIEVAQDTVDVWGNEIIHYSNAANASMSAISGFDTLKLTSSKVTVAQGIENVWSSITSLQMTDDSKLILLTAPTVPENQVKVRVTQAEDNWNTTNPIITAPAGTTNIFVLESPLSKTLAYNSAVASWTLADANLNVGQKGTSGSILDIDLGLPEDDSYTALSENATPYETYLQKLEDLGNAKGEVGVIEPIAVQGEVEIYVSPVGSDTNAGTKEAPLKSIAKALTYVELLQEDGDVDGIVVYLREGTYTVTEPITLNEKHSGKNGIPVVISAYDNEEVVISGGAEIAGNEFKTVTEVVEESVYGRLKESVRSNIVAVDLTELGFSEFGSITSDGSSYSVQVDGQPLTLARYPNVTKLALLGEVMDIGKVTASHSSFPCPSNSDSTGIEFKMTDFTPSTWENDNNIWLTGSLYAEWAVNTLRVAEIREESIKLSGGTGLGAIASAANTYYYFNVLEELDIPGEYYLDTENGILFLYPTRDISTSKVTFSNYSDHLIVLNGTKNVVLNGLIIENCGDHGVYMLDCEQTVVQNCVIRNVMTGILITGTKSGIIYSEIYNTSRKPGTISEAHTAFDYTPELNFMQNCYVYNTGMQNPKLSYITLQGTRNVVSHNLFQGTFSASIYMMNTKECIVEYNEIVGGPTGMNDFASIYQPYDESGSGDHIRYNYIHDIGNFSDTFNPSAIYLDEGTSGDFVYGNIIKNVPCGFFTNSGSENVIINNVVLDGRTGTVNGIRGEDNFASATIAGRINRAPNLETICNLYLSLSETDRAEIQQRYPLQVTLYEKIISKRNTEGDTYAGLFVSHDNYIANNLIYDCGQIYFGGIDHVIQNNTIVDTDPFANAEGHDYSLKEGVVTDFSYQIPSMERIGVTMAKQGLGSFVQNVPAQGAQKVDPMNVLVKWDVSKGADTYTLTIASNESLTENIKQVVVESPHILLEEDDYFDYGKIYYWTVTANTTAESRSVTSLDSGNVMFFTTMTEEEYLEGNKADLTVLRTTIAEAETLLTQITEVSEGGLYYDGTETTLESAILAAKDVEEVGEYQTQITVDRATTELEDAIFTAKVSMDVQYVTFDSLNAGDWSDDYTKQASIEVVDSVLQISNSASTEAIYKPGIGLREILCFKFKQEKFGVWWGFAVAQSNTAAYITDAANTDGYLICFSGNKIELQKRKGGTDFGVLTEKSNDGLFEAGQWYDIQLGAVNNSDGSVRIFFKINDTIVFDYLDESNAISGVENAGFIVKKNNGIHYVDKVELTEKIEVRVENIASNVSEVVVREPEGGWVEGTNTFTVVGDNACVVAVRNEDGTYTRLNKNEESTEGSYSYTVENVTNDTELVVAVAGDANGDGKVSNADITKLRAAYAGKTELDDLQKIVADVNGSNTITNADITKLRAVYAGKAELSW